MLCTVALTRRLRAAAAPARAGRPRRRARDRGRRRAPRAARRGDVRARVLRAVPEAVRAHGDDRRGAGAAAARSARRASRGTSRSAAPVPPPPRHGGSSRRTRASTSSATPTGARLRRQVGLPADARAGALHDAGGVDGRTRARGLPTHALGARSARARNRLIKALKPPGDKKPQEEPDGYVYLRCRLDIPFPILEVAREPAAGHSDHVGPPPRAEPRGGARRAAQLAVLRCATAGASCRGATIRRPTGRWAAASHLACGDLDPNLYRERLDAALGLFQGEDGGASLLAHIDGQMRAAAAEQRFERAAWLRRRHARLRKLIERLGGVMRAIHAGSRLVLAAHPTDERGATRSGSSAAASSTGARCRRTPTSSPPAPPTPCAPRRGRSSAAGCGRTRSPRRGSSACGSRRTRRACTS